MHKALLFNSINYIKLILVIKFLLFVSLISSCASSVRVTKSRDFSITKDTAIAVRSDKNANMMSSLESELLDLGLNVVPYEVASKRQETDIDFKIKNSNSESSVSGKISSGSVLYIPAAVVLTIDLNFVYYPASTYFKGGHVRVLDLKDKKLLADFKYSGGNWTIANEEDLIQLIRKDLESLKID